MTRRRIGVSTLLFHANDPHDAMLLSSSDLMWRALTPLVQQLEAIHRVLKVCATYYVWCVECAAGVALLLLGGLVVSEWTGERGAPTETEPSANRNRNAWASTLRTDVASRLQSWADEHLDSLSTPPFDSASTES